MSACATVGDTEQCLVSRCGIGGTCRMSGVNLTCTTRRPIIMALGRQWRFVCVCVSKILSNFNSIVHSTTGDKVRANRFLTSPPSLGAFLSDQDDAVAVETRQRFTWWEFVSSGPEGIIYSIVAIHRMCWSSAERLRRNGFMLSCICCKFLALFILFRSIFSQHKDAYFTRRMWRMMSTKLTLLLVLKKWNGQKCFLWRCFSSFWHDRFVIADFASIS